VVDGVLTRVSGIHRQPDKRAGDAPVGPMGLRLRFRRLWCSSDFLFSAEGEHQHRGIERRAESPGEDGIHRWFLHPQKRFGTTHRLINAVAVLRYLKIVARMGMFTRWGGVCFGVIWSFVFKTLAMGGVPIRTKSPASMSALNVR